MQAQRGRGETRSLLDLNVVEAAEAGVGQGGGRRPARCSLWFTAERRVVTAAVGPVTVLAFLKHPNSLGADAVVLHGV